MTAPSPSAKVAFITGANRGIGLATARDLGKLGITVVLGTRDIAKGQKAADTLKAEGIQAEAIAFDATNADSFAKVYDHLEKTYGKLDILVNNAGMAKEDFHSDSTLTVSPQIMKEIFETNFFGVVTLTQALLPLLKKSPAARIVNVSSILGSLGLRVQNNSPIGGAKAFAYNASKTAVNAFTIHLADALRDTPIKVNSAHPGWVKTDMGGDMAPLEVSDGSKTSVRLATLDKDGPTGGYFHLQDTLPW